MVRVYQRTEGSRRYRDYAKERLEAAFIEIEKRNYLTKTSSDVPISIQYVRGKKARVAFKECWPSNRAHKGRGEKDCRRNHHDG